MRRLIATLSVAAALVLVGCGSQDADPASDASSQDDGGSSGAPSGETEAEPAVESVTLTRTGGIAGVHDTWKIGPSDPGHRDVFQAASQLVSAGDGSGDGPSGKPPCCDFFQYNVVVRYHDGTSQTYRTWDGASVDPALTRLINAVLKTQPEHPDHATTR